jgi:hypothetical protein
MFQSKKARLLVSLCGLLVLFGTAIPASADSTTGATQSPSGSSSISTGVTSPAVPQTCGWESAESAYNRVSGSGTNYGITELNYSTCTRNVYTSVASYMSPCTSAGIGCGPGYLFAGNGVTYPCYIQTGQTTCTTAQASDAGVTAWAEGDIEVSSGVWAGATTPAY